MARPDLHGGWDARRKAVGPDPAVGEIKRHAEARYEQERCSVIRPQRFAQLGLCRVVRRQERIQLCSQRPVYLSLAYNDDPFVKGISNNPEGARQFLKRLGIRQQNSDGRWFVWEEIPVEERRIIISALAEQLIANGYMTP